MRLADRCSLARGLSALRRRCWKCTTECLMVSSNGSLRLLQHQEKKSIPTTSHAYKTELRISFTSQFYRASQPPVRSPARGTAWYLLLLHYFQLYIPAAAFNEKEQDFTRLGLNRADGSSSAPAAPAPVSCTTATATTTQRACLPACLLSY